MELKNVQEAVAFLREKGLTEAETGIILGTGLGALAERMDVIAEISYDSIPHFPVATVEFHKGKLVYGKLGDKTVLTMSGRFHYYEGYAQEEIAFPVRVMKFLGIRRLLISNAGGNMNLSWKKGDLMLLEDHINLIPGSPLRGRDAAAFGPLFTDMSAPYDAEMNRTLLAIAHSSGIPLHKGVYVAVSGPHLETRAEYRYLRGVGADVVGMSTVPEVIAANQLNLPVCAVSVLTDDCDPDNLKPVDINEIIATAGKAEGHLVKLFTELIQGI